MTTSKLDGVTVATQTSLPIRVAGETYRYVFHLG